LEFKPYDIADIRDNLLAGNIVRIKNVGKLPYDTLFVFTPVTEYNEHPRESLENLEVFTTGDDVPEPTSVFFPNEEYARHFGFFFDVHDKDDLSYAVISWIKDVNVQYDIDADMSVLQATTPVHLIAHHRGWYKVDSYYPVNEAKEQWVRNNPTLF
jgi:hypothetical protein